MYASDWDANYNLDPTKGGLSIAKDSLFTQYDVNADGTVTYKIFTRYATGASSATGTNAAPTLTPNNTFYIQASQVGSNNLTTLETITVPASPFNTVHGIATAISALNIPNVVATVFVT